MEAMKTTFLPNMKVLKENIGRIGKIRNVIFNYSQYSSRYDKLLNGELTNVFDPKYHGGSSFDLGVYPLYVALYLFGEPLSFPPKAKLFKLSAKANVIASLNSIFPEPLISAVLSSLIISS